MVVCKRGAPRWFGMCAAGVGVSDGGVQAWSVGWVWGCTDGLACAWLGEICYKVGAGFLKLRLKI